MTLMLVDKILVKGWSADVGTSVWMDTKGFSDAMMACWKRWRVYDKVENGRWSDDVASDMINHDQPYPLIRPTLKILENSWKISDMINHDQPYPLLRPTLKIPMLGIRVHTASYTVLASNDSVVWFDLAPENIWSFDTLLQSLNGMLWKCVFRLVVVRMV